MAVATSVVLLAGLLTVRVLADPMQNANGRLAQLEAQRLQEEHNFQMGLGLSDELRDGYAKLATDFAILPPVANWAEYRLAEIDYSRDQWTTAIGRLQKLAARSRGTDAGAEATLLLAEILDSPYNPKRDPAAAQAVLDDVAGKNPANQRAQTARLARLSTRQISSGRFADAAETLKSKVSGVNFLTFGPLVSPIDQVVKAKHNEETARVQRNWAFAHASLGDYASAYASLKGLLAQYTGADAFDWFTHISTREELDYQQALALAAQPDKKTEGIAELKAFAQRHKDSHLALRALARVQQLDPQPAVLPMSVAAQAPESETSAPASGCICGPVALASALGQLQHQVGLDTLVRAAGTSEQGTSMLGLIRAAREQGVTAYGLRVAKLDLSAIPLPAVALLRDHYVTVTAVKAGEVSLVDPLAGSVTKPRTEFDTL